ncbi:MAG: hypothetical protein ACREH8_14960, partial [Opitutaceae bacterium]
VQGRQSKVEGAPWTAVTCHRFFHRRPADGVGDRLTIAFAEPCTLPTPRGILRPTGRRPVSKSRPARSRSPGRE